MPSCTHTTFFAGFMSALQRGVELPSSLRMGQRGEGRGRREGWVGGNKRFGDLRRTGAEWLLLSHSVGGGAAVESAQALLQQMAGAGGGSQEPTSPTGASVQPASARELPPCSL